MALGTYSELQSTVLTVMDREGDAVVTAYLPVAIALAEAKINRNLRVGDMEASATLTASGGVATLPTDFAAARRVEVQPYGPLEPVMPEYAAFAHPARESGPPAAYTIRGDTLTTFPAYSGSVALDYYKRIPALSNTNTTNWLLTKHPDLYFFLTLSEAYAFIKDGETALLWNQRGIASIGEIVKDDTERRYSGASIRVRGATP